MAGQKTALVVLLVVSLVAVWGGSAHAQAAPELKLQMLDLINEERMAAGLGPVALGTNSAAQSHADDMLESCSSAHWGADGLKPYMRYTLAGGHQYNAENVSGLDYCVTEGDNYRKINPDQRIISTMDGFMSSPGHRDNILDPRHKKVSLGIAHDDYNMKVVQHFEYGYVHFDAAPSISGGGELSFSLSAINGFEFSDDVTVVIYYDRVPHGLTGGQLASTSGYGLGEDVIRFLEPLPPGWHYGSLGYHTEVGWTCPDPYLVPPETPAPGDVDEALEYHKRAKAACYTSTEKYFVPDKIAAVWNMTTEGFEFKADLGDTLSAHGSGAYTVTVYDFPGDDSIPLTGYSVFHEVGKAPTSIYGTVFLDSNSNGVRDASEQTMPGYTMITVDLLTGDARTTTTGSDGSYTFYSVATSPNVTLVQAWYYPFDHVLTTGSFYAYLAPESGTVAVWDVGFRQVGSSEMTSLAVEAYHDLDSDGVRDPGEPAFPGVTIHTYVYTTAELEAVVTGPDGSAVKPDLIPADWLAQAAIPAGYTVTSAPDPLTGVRGALLAVAPEPGSTRLMEVGLGPG